MQIQTDKLALICRTVSGHASKFAIDGITPEQLSEVLTAQGIKHRVLDVNDPAAFDDKLPTVISGVEDISQTNFACMLSSLTNLRFRNVLFFPTKKWFEAEEGEIQSWFRFSEVDRLRFRDRVTVADLEGF